MVVTLGPYDSLRDYIAALDASGRLLRIPDMDQDKFEATAFAYRQADRLDSESTRAFLIEQVKIDGNVVAGPVVANLYGRWQDEALAFGIDPAGDSLKALYRRVLGELQKRMSAPGQWNRIAPVTVDAAVAPCKQVRLTGAAINLLAFPWLKNFPTDGGRYINMASVILQHPEHGRNVGTYRCQVKSATRIGVNPEPGQHGWRMLTDLKRKGVKEVPCAVALAPDPITFAVSSNKMAGFGQDELFIAGGLRGKPVEIVTCETSDVMVPAHAEMIVEGVIPLDAMEPEGPYGEMYGYQGPRKEQNFFMNVTTVTHRQNPVFPNSFTGITHDMPRAPQTAAQFYKYKAIMPNITSLYIPRGANGIVALTIDKRMAGEGMAAGQAVATDLGKVVVVFDSDIDVLNPGKILHAIGARWQPHPASTIIPQTLAMAPDPSQRNRGMSSKIIIDATRQWPEEGGPPSWPPLSRDQLEKECPEAFQLVDGKWDSYWR
ncbi:MAG: UbiD family decarboxylase [Alphaproteobacteria bacterium]|nr:UbiD family decarboxylase [Alphaproteobacteria bacterium]